MTVSTSDLLADAFVRISDTVRAVVSDLTAEELAVRPGGHGNSIAWLIWHLTRVQDDHVAGVAHTEQVWTSEGWVEHFGLPLEPGATGYGHSSDEVAAVRVESGGLLVDYHDAVHAQTERYLTTIDADDLDRVIDEAWDPPVTLGVRLMSVIGDDLQHVGQAAYARGLLR